jgi:hypothetical protein
VFLRDALIKDFLHLHGDTDLQKKQGMLRYGGGSGAVIFCEFCD